MGDDDHPVAEFLHNVHVVARDECRPAFAGHLAEGLPHLVRAVDVESKGWLVDHQDRGLSHQRGGDRELLLHSARQLARLGVALVGEAEALQQLVGQTAGGPP